MTSNFTQYKSTKRLQELSKNPFDLTNPSNLTPERIQNFTATACGYTLLFGTERISNEALQLLFSLAQEADVIEKMQEMQAGEILNRIEGQPSENRSVLHTATRDFFENPQQNPEAKKAAQLALKETQKLRTFIQEIDEEGRFTDLILIGIGGSELGPKAHYLALESHLKSGRKAHFVANIDPDDLNLTLKKVNLDKTLVLVISKTGTTMETQNNEAIIRSNLKKAGLNPKEHMVSVTMPGSPLDNIKEYRACFYIWDWIGGRYSSTSMVGGVLLAFSFGFEIYWEFLRGANAMDKNALNPELKNNLPLIAALIGIWNRNFLNHSTLAIIPYAQVLSRYPAHIQQLDMESNGKQIDRQGNPVSFETGPIIWGEAGTSSQHSFFQLLHQGTTIVPMEFIGFQECQTTGDSIIQGTTSQQKLVSNLFAQILALATGKTSENSNKSFPGNRPSHLLLAKKLTPYTLGALLAFFEHKVAFQGFIWNINSFDQEGVQLGKEVANRIIGRFKVPDSAAYPLADSFIQMIVGKQ